MLSAERDTVDAEVAVFVGSDIFLCLKQSEMRTEKMIERNYSLSPHLDLDIVREIGNGEARGSNKNLFLSHSDMGSHITNAFPLGILHKSIFQIVNMMLMLLHDLEILKRKFQISRLGIEMLFRSNQCFHEVLSSCDCSHF